MVMKSKAVAKTPREVKTFDELCALPCDNVSSTTHWIVVSEASVVLTQQRVGEPTEASITIPRRVFNRFIDWYNTGKLHR